MQLTAEILRQRLSYDPETGVFIWLVATSPRVSVGSVAGYTTGGRKGPRTVIQLDGKKYHAARLAWLYATGKWPDNLVDHWDGNGTNNRWSNLRDVSNQVNMQNQRKANADNLLAGLLGVSWRRCSGKWRAQIGHNGKTIFLGRFTDPAAAHAAYVAAKRKLHVGCTL